MRYAAPRWLGQRMQFNRFKRREFITLLGGAAAAWPLAASAQQRGRVRTIGVLMNFLESDPAGQVGVAAFRDELKKLGWREDSDLRIELRWAEVIRIASGRLQKSWSNCGPMHSSVGARPGLSPLPARLGPFRSCSRP